jgi:hypothetical protein
MDLPALAVGAFHLAVAWGFGASLQLLPRHRMGLLLQVPLAQCMDGTVLFLRLQHTVRLPEEVVFCFACSGFLTSTRQGFCSRGSAALKLFGGERRWFPYAQKKFRH